MIKLSKEYEDMADIWLRTSVVAHPFVSPGHWRENYNAMRDKYLPAAENYVYIDRETDDMLGFISLVGDKIEALFVDPGSQGRGVGKALLSYAASLRGKLTLAVYAKNEFAVEFYSRNGFIVDERRVDPVTGEDELIMVRATTSAKK